MREKYFIYLLFILTSFAFQFGYSQSYAEKSITTPPKIEGLSVYPNPVNSSKGFVFITSKQNFTKRIEIYDILGKRISSTTLTGKQLNISELKNGVYILKITENNVSETRKLIVK